ncbi:MAG: hypothetical protein KGH64_01200 [Candidatus Micrarchaeota archaeon]|nr:hypothetical protein [Candidatus Micrarchaeota archaeon]MDE1833934.1 hypothetical protein [Candidatus Micrarchaeota archaeon]MDE1859944.1 hypothetical protein [Candidatus Micrarchaeota archaeon]
MESKIMNQNWRITVLCSMLLIFVFTQNLHAFQFTPTFPNFINCGTGGLASAEPPSLGPGVLDKGPGSYAGKLSEITNYQTMLRIVLLLVAVMISILSVAYAFGTAFQIESLVNFAKTELLEQMFNVGAIAVVFVAIASLDPFITFFTNLGLSGIASTASLGTAPAGYTSTTHAYNIFVDLCNAVDFNIVRTAFENWFSLVISLFWVNLFNSLVVSFMPNSFGFSFNPYGGLSLMIQLIWDDQSAYFLAMFFGLFLIVLIFLIDFLFPLFFIIGIALRSFPWTRAAGGSLMAMFIAFYIIFPGLLYPFIYSSSLTGVTGLGLCTGSAYNTLSLCQTPGFVKGTFVAILNGFHESFAIAYYDDVSAFVDGMVQVGLSVMGLIVALLIAYESTEKIGTLLGAPSVSAQRALSRIL